MAAASSRALRQLCHGVGVKRSGLCLTNDCRSSTGVPISLNSMYDAKAKSKPPSHSIVIVRLISLSYSRWIISSKCGMDAIAVIVSGRPLESEQIRNSRLRLGRPSDLKTEQFPPSRDDDPKRQERAALALQIDDARD